MRGCDCIIESVEQMVLRDGDIVVITLSQTASPEVCASLHNQMTRFVPKGVKVLVMLPGVEVHVAVTEAQLLETLMDLRKECACL